MVSMTRLGRPSPTARAASPHCAISHFRVTDADIVVLELTDGRTVTLAVADEADAAKVHQAVVDGKALGWTGHVGRFDERTAGEARQEVASGLRP